MPVEQAPRGGPQDAAARRAERRLRGLRIHFGIFAGLAVAAVAAMLLFNLAASWIFLPLVGWGPMLALHVAYVMGLFDGLLPDRRADENRRDPAP